MKFGLTWKCPHHPNGCEDGGKFSERATQCRLDKDNWILFNKAISMAKPHMKKPAAEPAKPTQVAVWQDADFEKQWPYLASWLAEPKWEDGSPRETGTLTIFVQEGYLKACMNDRACNRSCFLTSPSMTLLLDAMEAGLELDNHEWRKKKS